MEYLSDRTGKLKKEAESLGLDETQKAFVDRLLKLIADMAVIIDDAVDAVDELDMRLLEIEQQHDVGNIEEPV
jgi:hypothetical protein